MSKTLILKPHTPAAVRISVTVQEDGSRTYVAKIGEFTHAHDFMQLVHILTTASDKDKVCMFIDSPGGNALACRFLIDAMQRTKATTITDIGQQACSCGAYAWAYGKIRRMSPLSRLMFHTSSHGAQGKTRSIKEEAVVVETQISFWLDQLTANGTLTEEERVICLDGKKDVWLTYSDMKGRGALSE